MLLLLYYTRYTTITTLLLLNYHYYIPITMVLHYCITILLYCYYYFTILLFGRSKSKFGRSLYFTILPPVSKFGRSLVEVWSKSGRSTILLFGGGGGPRARRARGPRRTHEGALKHDTILYYTIYAYIHIYIICYMLY